MNKFEQNLTKTNADIKGARAKRVSNFLTMAQEDLVNDLKRKKHNLENEMDDLADLSPKKTTSLDFTDVTGKDWVSKMHNCKVQLALVEEELRIAEETYNEWFTEQSKSEEKVSA